MAEVPFVLSVESSAANQALFGPPLYPNMQEQINVAQGMSIFINANDAFNPSVNLPSGFTFFVPAILLFMQDLVERRILKALRPYYVAILPAQGHFGFILHQVQHALDYWLWAANEYSFQLSDPNDTSYIRLPDALEHHQAGTLVDLLIDIMADLSFHIANCIAQLSLLANQFLLNVLGDDDSDDDDDEWDFDFEALMLSQLHAVALIPSAQ